MTFTERFKQTGMTKEDYQYESVTEYDIAEPKRYDMKFGAAKHIVLSGYDGEKMCVCIASNSIQTLQSDFKVKIDDTRNRIDVDVTRGNDVTEFTAKEAAAIFVLIPSQYIMKAELAVNAETVEIHSLKCDSIELNIKTRNVILNGVAGSVEIDCNLDMNVVCRSLSGKIAINQVSAASKISIPEETVFTAVAKGIGTSISFEKNGKPAESFDSPGSGNIIELNGMKSELIIVK